MRFCSFTRVRLFHLTPLVANAMLVDDVLIRIIYMACAETPLILLINRLARSLVPLDRNLTRRCLETSVQFHRHDRERWTKFLRDNREYLGDFYVLEEKIRLILPFGDILTCWRRWQEIFTNISCSYGVDRIFYDNLAFRLFKHCVLSGKLHLMGPMAPIELIGSRAPVSRWWNDKSYKASCWIWPSLSKWFETFEVVAIFIQDLPPVYLRYEFQTKYSIISTEGGTLQFLHEPLNQDCKSIITHRVSFQFLDDTECILNQHGRYMQDYITCETRHHASMIEYKCYFVESRLIDYPDGMLSILQEKGKGYPSKRDGPARLNIRMKRCLSVSDFDARFGSPVISSTD